MTKCSALVATAIVSALLLAPTLPAQTTDAAAPSAGVSKVRIVRLSEVKGQVQLDRNNGRGFEPGIANLPIVEQSRLKTGEGVAEVEFEDNSTLRLAPNSEVDFPQLDRLSGGSTASSVHLVQGMAYISLVKSKTGNEFNLLFGQQKLALPPGGHVRLQMDGTEARLAVLDGSLRIEEQAGIMDVSKKKTVTFDMLEHQQPTLAKDILPEPYDSWDQSSAGYHSRVANYSAFNGSPYSYGLNDMMYYGSFMDAGGCGGGMMWRPYFASAAWDPYSNGAYAWYQGAGYSWVSPYPWGWTPYHSGSWNFCPGTGWGWQPGNSWYGLNNVAANVPQSGGGVGVIRHVPPAPIHPPRTGEPTMLAVNQKPLVRSELGKSDSFVFRKDSAGLGVPRDGMGKLEKFSANAVNRGEANTRVYMSAPATAMPGGRPTNTAVMAGSIHRGSAPPPSSMGGGSPSYSAGSSAGRGGGGSSPTMSSSPAPSHVGGSSSSSGGSSSHSPH
jgi:hypothetical protein